MKPSPQDLYEDIRAEFLKSFPEVPEYGSIGFTVFLSGGRPTRLESTTSFSRMLERGGVNG